MTTTQHRNMSESQQPAEQLGEATPAGNDIHARVMAQARGLDLAPHMGMREAGEVPEVHALMRAAVDAIGAAVPTSFIFCGRSYWLRCRFISELHVFAGPAEGSPLVSAMDIGKVMLGHTPQH